MLSSGWCLSLSAEWSVAFDWCPSGDNFWCVDVIKWWCFSSVVDLSRFFWCCVSFFFCFDGRFSSEKSGFRLCLRQDKSPFNSPECFQPRLLDQRVGVESCNFLSFVSPYLLNDVVTFDFYFQHLIWRLPVERCKKLFRALVIILWVQQKHELFDFEWLSTGFSVILCLLSFWYVWRICARFTFIFLWPFSASSRFPLLDWLSELVLRNWSLVHCVVSYRQKSLLEHTSRKRGRWCCGPWLRCLLFGPT